MSGVTLIVITYILLCFWLQTTKVKTKEGKERTNGRTNDGLIENYHQFSKRGQKKERKKIINKYVVVFFPSGYSQKTTI